jgi:hypothetical protein
MLKKLEEVATVMAAESAVLAADLVHLNRARWVDVHEKNEFQISYREIKDIQSGCNMLLPQYFGW